MSVKIEPSGRRSMEIELEVAGTPEAGLAGHCDRTRRFLMVCPDRLRDARWEGRFVDVHFGPGMEPRSDITAWDPPRMYATTAESFMPGSPPIASEWSVEAREGGGASFALSRVSSRAPTSGTASWKPRRVALPPSSRSCSSISHTSAGSGPRWQQLIAPATGYGGGDLVTLTAAVG